MLRCRAKARGAQHDGACKSRAGLDMAIDGKGHLAPVNHFIEWG
jgi:hypothetical protein